MYTQDQIDAYMSSLATKGYKPDDVAKYREHLETNFGPKAPGGSVATARPQDIYSAGERVASGFGNLRGEQGVLSAKGYKNVARTKDGETVVQKPDGSWVYEPTNFFPKDWEHPIDTAHPANYVEKAVGAAPALAGMVAGGMSAGIPGAAAGAFTGEGLRQEVGKRLGTYEGTPEEQFNEAAPEAAKGAMAEIGGQALNMLPVKRLLPKYFTDKTLGEAMDTSANYAMDKLRGLTARVATAGTLGKVPAKSAERMIERPNQVMAMTESTRAGEPSNVAAGIADQAELELKGNLRARGADVGEANRRFNDRLGRTSSGVNFSADTRPILRKSEDFLNNVPVNEQGRGKLDADEINALKNWANSSFRTRETSTTPVGGGLISHPIAQPPRPAPFTPIRYEPDFAAGFKVVPGEVEQNLQAQPPIGYYTDFPSKKWDSLKGTSDSLSTEIGNWRDTNRLAKSLPVDLQYKENVQGAIKDAMHAVDPELAGADETYAGLKRDARILRPLDTATGGEGMISNIMGKNKTEMQEAAKRAIPQTYGGPILDLQAARNFKSTMAGHKDQLVAGTRAAMGVGAAYASHAFDIPALDSLAIGATVGAMTDPWVWKNGLYYGAKSSSWLTEPLRDGLGRQIIPATTYEQSPWGGR